MYTCMDIYVFMYADVLINIQTYRFVCSEVMNIDKYINIGLFMDASTCVSMHACT